MRASSRRKPPGGSGPSSPKPPTRRSAAAEQGSGGPLQPGAAAGGVAALAGRLLRGQRTKEADRQMPAENIVAPQPDFRLGAVGQAVPNLGQPRDQAVERRVVADLDIVLDHPAHSKNPPRSFPGPS